MIVYYVTNMLISSAPMRYPVMMLNTLDMKVRIPTRNEQSVARRAWPPGVAAAWPSREFERWKLPEGAGGSGARHARLPAPGPGGIAPRDNWEIWEATPPGYIRT